MYADDIKVMIVSALLPTLDFDEVLGSEVRFGDGKYRADLVVSSPTRLSAIEIKGPRDNFDKLDEQARGYGSMFLDFSVATTANWLPVVRSRLPRSTGLMTIDEDGIQYVRKPQQRNTLSTDASLKWLRSNDLKRLMLLHDLPQTGLHEALSEKALKLSRNSLSEFTLTAIHERLATRFESFRSELGSTVTLDDVRMLTLSERIIGKL